MTHISPKDILHQQVMQVYQQATGALMGMPAVAVVTVLLLWQLVPHAQLVIWVAIIIALSLMRLSLLMLYMRDSQAKEHAVSWVRAYAVLESISGVTWAALVFWLFPDNPVDQAMVMLILGAMAVGAMPMLSPVRWLYWAYLAPLSALISFTLFFHPELQSTYLLFFTLIFTIVLVVSGDKMYSRTRQSIALVIKNVSLVDTLKRANDRLERQFANTKQAERVAREAEAQFRILANATNEGVLLYKNMAIIDSNQQICHMLGYEAEELRQLSLNEIFANGDSARVEEIFVNNETNRFEAQCLRRDHSSFPVEVNKRSMMVEQNKIDILTIYDISDLKQMSETKDQFISTVSHELRTPLTSIHAALGMLKNEIVGQLNEKQMDLVTIANSNSERLKALVNDLLDIQRLDGSGLSFQMEKINLTDLIGHAISINQGYASSHQCRYQLLDEYPAYYVHADHSRLMQVMTNLLSNAAKFSPADAVVEIELEQQDDFITTRVIDHGPGIPEEFQQRIFERFAQADTSDTRAHTGSGLGLYIAKTIIESMQGVIGYRSEPGEGACFFFTLPLYHGETES